jgi:enterobactin synthetase component D
MPAQLDNPHVFPRYVAQHTITFDVEDPRDYKVQFPGIVLPDSLGNAVRKRQAEFLAGRHCVREALRALRFPDPDRPIGSGPHREPLWPPGIVGSITHTRRFASASIARSIDARAIGIDAEQIVSEEQADRLSEQIAVPGEIERLVAATGWMPAAVFTLVFSAKETVFKCLYPEVGRYFDFQAAEVIGIDRARGSFSARLLETLTPSFAAGYAVHGNFVRDEASIFTAMVLPA